MSCIDFNSRVGTGRIFSLVFKILKPAVIGWVMHVSFLT
jgi:hypothetical protein